MGSIKTLAASLLLAAGFAGNAGADDMSGKTITIDITMPICGFADGTQSCVWEHSAWFYLAAIFFAGNDDLFYSFSFHSNFETEGVRIPTGTGSGERVDKTNSGDPIVHFVEVERLSANRLHAIHTMEMVEDGYIRKNAFTLEMNGKECRILEFRQEHFSNTQLKYAYGKPTSLICKVQDGPQTDVYGK
ncbi:hypothetical protein FIV06_12955 [Labrenzia sp. THAF191b]|uniref:hypothetical protein n=1 Tax=unclassified Labrenzia TaxID=2648686 RepID=UPI001267B359|nr:MULTISPECIES: hypothetical protein [unclassified Labrenzia]QFS98330.1 hypothetical protein FIV06_12955 [Labrenzia sp. THAF191b]QFT04644.1 hypothetical protein FIV05_12950 [Labrenzia sp. THAF191a]QFT16188.1 hypothetical protein FIV03_12965 [Labrenzia sp. THAF187b]